MPRLSDLVENRLIDNLGEVEGPCERTSQAWTTFEEQLEEQQRIVTLRADTLRAATTAALKATEAANAALKRDGFEVLAEHQAARVREDPSIGWPRREAQKRTSVRIPLPSLAVTIYIFGMNVALFLVNVAGFVNHLLIGQSVWINVGVLLVTLAVMATVRSRYRLLLIRREELRETNFWRVIEHHITQPMPAMSPELAVLEGCEAIYAGEDMAWDPTPERPPTRRRGNSEYGSLDVGNVTESRRPCRGGGEEY